jgi:hypothetical protein
MLEKSLKPKSLRPMTTITLNSLGHRLRASALGRASESCDDIQQRLILLLEAVSLIQLAEKEEKNTHCQQAARGPANKNHLELIFGGKSGAY